MRHLGKKRLLKLKLKLSEPATVTIRLLAGKKLKFVRGLTINRRKAGTFTALLSLKHVAKRTYTLRISARDPQGLQSLVITRTLKVVR